MMPSNMTSEEWGSILRALIERATEEGFVFGVVDGDMFIGLQSSAYVDDNLAIWADEPGTWMIW